LVWHTLQIKFRPKRLTEIGKEFIERVRAVLCDASGKLLGKLDLTGGSKELYVRNRFLKIRGRVGSNRPVAYILQLSERIDQVLNLQLPTFGRAAALHFIAMRDSPADGDDCGANQGREES